MAEPSPAEPGPPAPPSTTPDLTRAERASLAIGRLLNERPAGKHVQYLWNDHVGRHFVRFAVGRRVFTENLDWLLERPSDRGVLFAINHRSFFDAHVVTYAVYQAGARWPSRLFFPVRSNFFYESPLGIAVNVLLGAGTLYPPIFRDRSKATLTRESVDKVIGFLGEADTLVGVHPEGTRKKDDDPYTLLPAQPGVGQIALRSRATVVPVFINGLVSTLGANIARTYRPTARRDDPVMIVYGDALDYADLAARKPRAALYKQMADRMRDAITALGERERELRAACARGELGDDHPGWVANRVNRW